MITVEKLSYSFPEKDLYKEISFTIEDGVHTVLIGSNGCGKSTLVDLLLHAEDYLYEGKIIKEGCRKISLVSQFVKHDKDTDASVFDYLCQDFRRMQAEQDLLCQEMETEEDFQQVYDRYQKAIDEFEAVDGYNHESNIHKQLKLAGLTDITEIPVSKISGGEYKLIQIIRQMMSAPDLLVMDEPDAFLDFSNLQGLESLINSYKGTLLVVTHSRYLLNHCFECVLHLENGDLQQFEGSYMEYRLALLQTKIEMQEEAIKEAEWIESQEKLVEKLRAEATRIANVNKGKQLKARASYLERLKARQIKAPFVEIPEPQIVFPDCSKEQDSSVQADSAQNSQTQDSQTQDSQTQDSQTPNSQTQDSQTQNSPASDSPAAQNPVLTVTDYSVAFDKPLLSHVSFQVNAGEKAALVGPNGTGKTTLLRALQEGKDPAIAIADPSKTAYFSQIYGDMLHEDKTVYEEFRADSLTEKEQLKKYLGSYCFEEAHLSSPIGVLSGGEKNLLQLAKIGLGTASFLIMDEPASHLDLYAQTALEKAIREYKGAVLMVSHDFYTVAESADYVLYVEEGSIRRMSQRAFRKMIYRDHFSKDYLELEQKKREQELKAESLLKAKDYEGAREVCIGLEETIHRMQQLR